MDFATVAIAGATGTIGRPLARQLLARAGVQVRAASRTPALSALESDPALTMVGFDWQRPDTAPDLVAGADLLVVIPPSGQHPLRTTEALIASARTSGVRHVVLLSTLGAHLEPGFAFGRWAMQSEQALAASGLPWTVVRPNSYMSNFAGMLGPGLDGMLRLPWRDGATSFVDPADVSASVAAVVRDPDRHHDAVYELTGPAALTCADIARTLSEASATPVTFVPTSLDEIRARMTAHGAPLPFVEALLELHEVMATHARAYLTADVRHLVGNAPRSLANWARPVQRVSGSLSV